MTDVERARWKRFLEVCGYTEHGDAMRRGRHEVVFFDEVDPRYVEHLRVTLRRLWFHREQGSDIASDELRHVAEELGYLVARDVLLPPWCEADAW